MHDTFLDIVPIDALAERLGLSAPLDYPSESLVKPLTEWRSEVDDAPVLRYLYRHLQPARHLEFGIRDAASACLCLEECQATVWTVNPLRENRQQAGTAQSNRYSDLGDYYRSAGFGHRVCQILTDGRDWGVSSYPPGFFDSALIDGGPTIDVVSTDSRTALSLVKPGGLIVWRDFCPDPALFDSFDSVAAVVRSVLRDWDQVSASVRDVFWIRPSFLLAAIRR